MADARPNREEVLAWMADQRAGPTEAARHFGIPVGTVKRWHHEAGGRAAIRGAGSPVSPGKKATERTPIPSHPRASLSAPPARSAAALPPNDRARLRGAVRRLLEFLDSDTAITDTKRAAEAARALDILLARCPDILSFEERTNELDSASGVGGEADARRLQHALSAGRRGGT